VDTGSAVPKPILSADFRKHILVLGPGPARAAASPGNTLHGGSPTPGAAATAERGAPRWGLRFLNFSQIPK